MPTDTFFKLPEEKKKKIRLAAEKEFSRVPFEETSIKNIVEQAGIARGSFYQYFENKEDLLAYLVRLRFQNIESFLDQTLEETKGDPFAWFLTMYDFMIKECFNKKEIKFYQRIIGDAKTKEDTFVLPKDQFVERFLKKLYEKIDSNQLAIDSEKEAKLIVQILSAVTRKAIVSSFNYSSKEEARKDYIKQLDYLKYGMLRKERKEKRTC